MVARSRKDSAAKYDPRMDIIDPSNARGGMQREREPRRVVALDGFVMFDESTFANCKVHDLSYNGCSISTDTHLSVGDRIKLVVSGQGKIETEVRWEKDGRFGLKFDKPDRSDRHVPRKADRCTITGHVTMKRDNRAKLQVDVHDFSTHGCKIELVDRLAIGEKLYLKIDGLEMLEGRVRWCEDFRAGIEFSRPLYPAVCDMLIAKMR